LGSLGNLGDETFQQNLLGLAVEAGLDSSKLTVDATLLCKDAKFAEDAKKILEGSQVVVRNALKAAHGVPREAADVVDSIKFSVSGAKVKGSLQTSLEPFLKGIPENLRRAQMSARISSAKVQVELLDKALQTYYLDMGSFPSQSVGLQALRVEPRDLRGSNKWAGPYLDREIPADPWGKPYQYAYPPRMNRDKSDVSTVSPDNQIIGNWTEEATGR
jgi:type II secretion system protein G